MKAFSKFVIRGKWRAEREKQKMEEAFSSLGAEQNSSLLPRSGTSSPGESQETGNQNCCLKVEVTTQRFRHVQKLAKSSNLLGAKSEHDIQGMVDIFHRSKYLEI